MKAKYKINDKVKFIYYGTIYKGEITKVKPINTFFTRRLKTFKYEILFYYAFTDTVEWIGEEEIIKVIILKENNIEKRLREVVLPVEVPKEEYKRVTDYLITIGFFKNLKDKS